MDTAAGNDDAAGAADNPADETDDDAGTSDAGARDGLGVEAGEAATCAAPARPGAVGA
jgi:hypothetical protein